MLRIPILLAALVGTTTGVAAATLAGGPVYGGGTQNTATCYFFNAGSGFQSIRSAQLIPQGGGPVHNDHDNCTGTNLGPNGICVIQADGISNGVPFACKFLFSGQPAFARGELELRQGSTVLHNLPLTWVPGGF